MGRVWFIGRDMVRIKLSDKYVVPGSSNKHVDPGKCLIQQNQDVQPCYAIRG